MPDQGEIQELVDAATEALGDEKPGLYALGKAVGRGVPTGGSRDVLIRAGLLERRLRFALAPFADVLPPPPPPPPPAPANSSHQ